LLFNSLAETTTDKNIRDRDCYLIVWPRQQQTKIMKQKLVFIEIDTTPSLTNDRSLTKSNMSSSEDQLNF